MARVIRDRAVVEDAWQTLADGDTALPAGADVIVPWSAFREAPARFTGHDGRLGVLVDGTADLDALAPHLDALALIAIDFPVFKDGRGYSVARLLRERHGYEGELRAVGDVLRDQLFYMRRVGFDSLALRDDQNVDDAMAAFTDFSAAYQPAMDGTEVSPRWRRSA